MPATPSRSHPRVPSSPYALVPAASPDLGSSNHEELPMVMECLQAALAQLTLSRTSTITDTETENAAPAFTTTQSPTLDLFFQLVRNCSAENIRTMVAKAWLHSPEDTMRILLHGRDIRHGKGERWVAHQALMWIRKNKPSTYLLNLLQLVEVGYYKDLLLWCEMAEAKNYPKLSTKETIELELLAEQLMTDYRKLQSADQEGPKTNISLAAKWAPSEKRKYDGYAKRLARLMFPPTPGAPRENSFVQYRKVLVKLRAHLVLVETQLAAKQFDQIDFARVPSKAHNRLKRAFAKHQPERYAQYLEDVKAGKKEINSTGLQPHELVRQYINNRFSWNIAADTTIEMQWKEMVDKIKRSGSLSKSLSIVDVSGSMNGTPMEVAVALGMLTSELATGPFENQVITFTAKPSLFHLSGSTLSERVKQILEMPWGMNTNLIAVFNLLIQKAVREKLTADQMPETLFIFSDMQFDQCTTTQSPPSPLFRPSDLSDSESSNEGETDDWVVVPVPDKLPLDDSTFGLIKKLYEKQGYKVPRVVFWNLRSTPDKFPVRQNEQGVAIISGFSEQLLRIFIERPTDINPLILMQIALEPYKVVIADCDR